MWEGFCGRPAWDFHAFTDRGAVWPRAYAGKNILKFRGRRAEVNTLYSYFYSCRANYLRAKWNVRFVHIGWAPLALFPNAMSRIFVLGGYLYCTQRVGLLADWVQLIGYNSLDVNVLQRRHGIFVYRIFPLVGGLSRFGAAIHPPVICMKIRPVFPTNSMLILRGDFIYRNHRSVFTLIHDRA